MTFLDTLSDIRKTLEKDFSAIHGFNPRGNQRISGEQNIAEASAAAVTSAETEIKKSSEPWNF